MCEQNSKYLAKHSELGSKNLNTICLKIFKSTKIAITACKFSKISRGSMPPDPLEPFLFLNQLQISSAEKIRLTENVEIRPPLFKFLATPLPVLVVGEENLAIVFGPLQFRNASAIAVSSSIVSAMSRSLLI